MLRIFAHTKLTKQVLPALTALARQSGLALSCHTQPILDLEDMSVACARIVGSTVYGHFPYVYPLTCTEAFEGYTLANTKALELIPHIDWIYLGGDIADFCARLGIRMSLGDIHELTLVFYAKTRGTFAEGENSKQRLHFRRRFGMATNGVQVAKLMERLMTLPEERWPELGYSCAQDHFPTFAPFIECLAPPSPRRILDIGCGLGQTTRSLARAFPDAEVIGLDIDAGSLRVAEAHFRLPNLCYRQFNMDQDFPFEDDSVDLVVSAMTLNFCTSPLQTAGEIFRVLTPEGALVYGGTFDHYHLFWDYPRAALFPTKATFTLADWNYAAGRHDLNINIYPSTPPTWMFIEAYENNTDFRTLLDAFSEKTDRNEFLDYHSYGIITFSRHENNAQHIKTDANHTNNITKMTNSSFEKTPEIIDLFNRSKRHQFDMLGLHEEADIFLEFIHKK
jgi:SAM-dependent methyltransferase